MSKPARGSKQSAPQRGFSIWLLAIPLLFAVGAMVLMTPRAQAPGIERLGTGIDDVVLKTDAATPITWAALKGTPHIVFFGFTHCPELCPTTMAALDAAIARAKPAAPLQIYFVSIDPARDSPANLRAYFASFKEHVIALTGDERAIARVAGAFAVKYEKVALDSGDYTMSHTSTVFLIDQNGRVVDRVEYDAKPDVLDRKLAALLARQANGA